MTNRVLLPLILLGLTSLLIWSYSGSASDTPQASSTQHAAQGSIAITTSTGNHTLNVQFAATSQTQEQGMMHRDSWGDIDGMLFVFERERNRAFWMKNTKLPMDIIFFDADGMVTTIIQSAQPFDETLIQSASPSQFVLEIPAGNAGKLGIDESTRLEITPALREQ